MQQFLILHEKIQCLRETLHFFIVAVLETELGLNFQDLFVLVKNLLKELQVLQVVPVVDISDLLSRALLIRTV